MKSLSESVLSLLFYFYYTPVDKGLFVYLSISKHCEKIPQSSWQNQLTNSTAVVLVDVCSNRDILSLNDNALGISQIFVEELFSLVTVWHQSLMLTWELHHTAPMELVLTSEIRVAEHPSALRRILGIKMSLWISLSVRLNLSDEDGKLLYEVWWKI